MSNLVGRNAICQFHRELLAAKGEGEGLGLGDADDPRQQDGGAPVAVAHRPQLQDMRADVHHNVLHPIAVASLLVDVAQEHYQTPRLQNQRMWWHPRELHCVQEL